MSGRVYLSLGSNIEPERHLRAALDELRARFGEIECSRAWRCPAVGFDGPAFVNLAASMDSDLEPEALNAWLHALEDRHGRRRDVPRFSDRSLDIDIVLYGDRVLEGPGNLTLPRPELARHAFVLRPMAEIAPNLIHPTLGLSLAQIWAGHPERDVHMEPVDV